MEPSSKQGQGDSVPQQRYRIVRRLDVGGMAEIFLGKSVSLGGLEKDVAIKRVLPALASNGTFVEMFLDEARVSMVLNHANIVQVFDVGRSRDTWFLVMEYVDGHNLRRMLQKATEVGYRLPVGLACYLVGEVCKGLAHAHSRSDGDGQPLEIVHRDVSPPNILLSRSGEVKITDFGLAKAMNHSSATEPGIVKGKFSYLAPEAADGGDVDQRADVFAAGACLWELLANERLFLGEDDLATLELVRKAHVPTLAGRSDHLTPELDRILARSLARAPSDRYATAREMGAALSDYLFRHQLKETSYDVAAMLSYLFEQDGDRPPWDERLVQLIDDEINEALHVPRVADPASPLNPDDLRLPPPSGIDLGSLLGRLDDIEHNPHAQPDEGAQPRGVSTRRLLDRLEGPGGSWAGTDTEFTKAPPILWILIGGALLLLGIGVGLWL